MRFLGFIHGIQLAIERTENLLLFDDNEFALILSQQAFFVLLIKLKIFF